MEWRRTGLEIHVAQLTTLGRISIAATLITSLQESFLCMHFNISLYMFFLSLSMFSPQELCYLQEPILQWLDWRNWSSLLQPYLITEAVCIFDRSINLFTYIFGIFNWYNRLSFQGLIKQQSNRKSTWFPWKST